MTPTQPSIWALLTEAAATFPEPFSRAALISWIEKRRPDVETSSISTHIQYAVAGIPNRDRHPLGRREPLLERVDRGLYRRYRGSDRGAAASPRPSPVVAATAAAPSPSPVTGRVVLMGCSSRKGPGPAPARDLFEGTGFRKARDRAVGLRAPWFVLSAKYGLLDPDDVVGPYDVFLGEQTSAYRAAWGEWVTAVLATRVELAGAAVEIHAGDAYCAPLRSPLRRHGASVTEPLAGLSQGKRLAWPGYGEGLAEDTAGEDDVIARLLDPSTAVSPGEFLRRGDEGLDVPGLYTWWVDDNGAQQLSDGMGHPVRAGLLYVGKAGGHRTSAAPSGSTLWSRISRNHLRGNTESSTLRKSLAALLGAAEPISEDDLTAWMHAHIRVAVLPVPSEQVAELEDALVARTSPPLNLMGLPRDAARSALSRLRGLLTRPSRTAESGGAHPWDPSTAPDSSRESAPDVPAAFERRIRADVAAIVAAG
jgi:hypothetical protein